MLQDLMTGREETSLILMTDLMSSPGRRLLINWVYHLATRCDKVILVCFERDIECFKAWLPLDMQKKIINGRVTPTKLGRPVDYVMDDVRNIVSYTEGTVGVVIDSLTMLLIVKSAPVTCSFLDSLAAESQVTQVVAVLHRDVHNQLIRRQLEDISPTVIEVTAKEEKSMCSIRHCRRPPWTVFKSVEYFHLDDNFHTDSFGSVPPQGNLPQRIYLGSGDSEPSSSGIPA